MSRYHAYPEYKDSEAIWLGKIPADWDLYDGKRLFSSRREAAREDDEQLAASQKYGVIPQNLMMELNDAKVMLALKGTNSFRHVDANNFVISLRSFEGGIEHSSYVGCVSPAYTVLRSEKDIAPGYFKYLLKSAPYIAALQASTDSLRDGKSISYEQFGAIPLPYPQPEVQGAIAAFLDHETAKIDALIDKQRRLIELLNEKRQAVISHAVTKGLNRSVPMKDSGVEWMDRVPAHWRVSKLGYHASVSNGATPNRENMLFWESGTIGWLNSSKVNDEVIKEADQFITKLALSQTSVKPVNKGDLVMAITGEGQTRGRVAICNIEATINQHLAAISIRDKLLQHELLYLWLVGNYERIRYESEGAGSTKGAITCSEISAFPVILPPLEEQDQIVNYIAERKSKFDGLIGKAISAIELMQERRTALISAAVTGKIDVRGWQAAA